MRISEPVMLSAAKHPSIFAGAKKKKMQRFFTPLRFVQNDRRPGLRTIYGVVFRHDPRCSRVILASMLFPVREPCRESRITVTRLAVAPVTGAVPALGGSAL